MQRIDVKNLFQNVMILQRELCPCNFHIIYWLLHDPSSGEFANFIKKNANAQGLAQGGGWALVELTDA